MLLSQERSRRSQGLAYMPTNHEWPWPHTVVLMTNGLGARGSFHSCPTVQSPPEKGNRGETKENKISSHRTNRHVREFLRL
ncbi:hypothetical protein K0M31_001132 [Melipona bicolor]|uniref:Uncharacterized protein n=1 Tax=Melipona bicolor TaxID=60889 RepID=A0AA40GEX3_9HYME|nr:hypothetical protein K0M31_001132 [Melipona bicolor]